MYIYRISLRTIMDMKNFANATSQYTDVEMYLTSGMYSVDAKDINAILVLNNLLPFDLYIDSDNETLVNEIKESISEYIISNIQYNTVNSIEDINNVIENSGINDCINIILGANIDSDNTVGVIIPDKKYVEIDFNNFDINIPGKLFTINGGRLILRDRHGNSSINSSAADKTSVIEVNNGELILDKIRINCHVEEGISEVSCIDIESTGKCKLNNVIIQSELSPAMIINSSKSVDIKDTYIYTSDNMSIWQKGNCETLVKGKSTISGGIYHTAGSIILFDNSELINESHGDTYYNIGKLATEDGCENTGYAYLTLTGRNDNPIKFVTRDDSIIRGRSIEGTEIDPVTGEIVVVEQPKAVCIGEVNTEELTQKAFISIHNSVSYEHPNHTDIETLALAEGIELGEEIGNTDLVINMNGYKVFPMIEESEESTTE